MLIDYHVHPSYSIDSKGGSISDFCERAFKLGLIEICFTTHYDVDPQRREIDGFVNLDGERVSVNLSWMERYLKEIEEAQAAFGPQGLRVWSGLEVDYGSEFEMVIREGLSGFKFDYLLGAVHCLNHQALSLEPESEKYFTSRSARQVCEEYFSEVKKAIESGLFHAIAHLDFYKRFGVRYHGDQSLQAHQGLVEPILDLLAEKEVALELNALGYKDGFGEPYPGREILTEAKNRGVRLVTVGSDCHDLSRLGANLKEVMEIMDELGFELWRVSP